MPARRLDHRPVVIRKNDLVAMDVENAPGFIGHVALAAQAHPGLTSRDTLRVTDMQPPLVRGRDHEFIAAHGTVPLTDDETEVVGVFIDRSESEYIAANRDSRSQYVVRPHHAPVRSLDGTVICHRYSCGGFVLEAYRFAGLDLVVTGEEALPSIALETLLQAYAGEEHERVLSTPRLRERLLGLGGDGPWRILLAGYLLHSLARSETDIRQGAYRPRPGDEYYPARPPQPPPVSHESAA